MAQYNSYRDLVGGTLKYGDTCHFAVVGKGATYRYTVRDKWLTIRSEKNSDIIFKTLQVDPIEFCTKTFGYKARFYVGHAFPMYKTGDYEAATRTALQLFLLCEDPDLKEIIETAETLFID